MNIAIFGGSFDPPHIGHEKIALLALKALEIDKLFVVPTYLNPFKNDSHLDAKTRLELVNDIFNNIPKVKVLDFEVNQKEKVPTFNTIEYLKSIYNINKIYLIIGADNLKSIHLWYNAKKLKELVEFVVISRDQHSLTNEYINMQTLHLDINISSSKLRENMELKYIPKKIQQKVRKLWKIE